MTALRDPGAAADRRPRFPLRLALFGAAGVVSFGYGFLAHTPSEAGRLVQRFGYFAMAVTFLWWLLALYRLRPVAGWSGAYSWLAQNRPAILLIVGLTVVGFFTLPYSYKILYDELVLQATASNLHFFREFGTIVRGYEVEGVFRSIEVYVDKRPFFYPFVVSLLHDLTGYREANAYVLNTLLLPVSLLLLYSILRRLAGKWSSLAGLACFGASSLLVQNANGTGMEMLNLCMFLLTLWLAIEYLGQPDNERLSALVLSCVLLAQTRYESALFVAPAALAILEGWRRSSRVILPPAALGAPLLLIPCALHNIYLSGTPALWELREDVASRFAAKYVFENLKHAFLYFFDFSGQQLSSWWLSGVGLPALAVAALMVFRRGRAWKNASPAAMASVLFGAAVIANFGLLMFYFWGQLDDPIVARLILPFDVVLALAIAWSVETFAPSRQKKIGGWLMTGALVSYFAFGLQATAYNRDRNEQTTEIAWEQQWLATQPSRLRLMITNKSSLAWLIRRIPSISVPQARGVADKIQFHLRGGTFQEVLVSQYYRPVGPEGGFQLDPRDELPASFVLESVVERRMGLRLLRISRVTDIELPEKPGRQDSGNPAPKLPGDRVTTTLAKTTALRNRLEPTLRSTSPAER